MILLRQENRRTAVAEEGAKVIRVKREMEGDLFLATSPDLRGLLVAEPTLDGLEKAIPQVIVDLYAARKIAVTVIPVDDGNEGPHGAYVVVSDGALKANYRKPTPAAA
jgi:hypothetical protein